jgi:hypothetical protein
MFGVVDLQKVLMVSWFSQKCSRLQAFFIFRASKPTSLAPPSSNQLTSFFLVDGGILARDRGGELEPTSRWPQRPKTRKNQNPL